jgi:hypothetical protein
MIELIGKEQPEPMKRVTMARFFELLGAPLNNRRWSWGAHRADGAVFLRQWETDLVAGDDGREFVVIAHGNAPAGPREHGWRERLAHIAAVRGGAPCFLVLCAPMDAKAKAKTVRTFEARSIVVGGQVIDRAGQTLVQVVERRPVAEFLRGGTGGQTTTDTPRSDKRTFLAREFKGSRLRCLMTTSLSRQAVASLLQELVTPYAKVTPEDTWRPRGFLDPDEARLGESPEFLTPEIRQELTRWWLRIPERANTPNWDVVSTCRFDSGTHGLILVEAKAHAAELHASGKPPGNAENDAQIRRAIAEANEGLGGAERGWGLSADRNYQLSNRFAWAWKVATLGVPVVLVYLGFLEAEEMSAGAFRTADEWQQCVRSHTTGTVPEDVWRKRLPVGGSCVVPLIRAARVSAQVAPTGQVSGA